MTGRYVTAPEIPRSEATGGPDSTTAWEVFSGRGDPEQRFQIRKTCDCDTCEGSGKIDEDRCPECRGEGRTMLLVATAGTPEALGVALVQLGREGEFEGCETGVLDVMGEVGQKWILRPFKPSPRVASDAGRVLQRRRRLTK